MSLLQNVLTRSGVPHYPPIPRIQTRLPQKQGSKAVTLTTPPCTAEVKEWSVPQLPIRLYDMHTNTFEIFAMYVTR